MRNTCCAQRSSEAAARREGVDQTFEIKTEKISV